MKEITKQESMADQVRKRVSTTRTKRPELEGNIETMVSTGSTLLDLAISGGRVRGGGLPGGISVEISGLPGTGKTVLLCETAGAIKRLGGEVMFHDPEARLNKQFASIFGMDVDELEYMTPNTVSEMFLALRKWMPDNGKLNGVFTDSLAALSTDMEMDNDEGDKMGGRRAKELSEGFRKTARLITSTNTLMVVSNQLRENMDRAFKFSPKYRTPGGQSIGYYTSLRLSSSKVGSLSRERKIKGKTHKIIYGIEVEVEVIKSSIWHPHRTAPVTIDFAYGIDNIRDSLRYLRDINGTKGYMLNGNLLDPTLPKAIEIVENENLEGVLREEVIDTWEEIEAAFKVERKPKKR